MRKRHKTCWQLVHSTLNLYFDYIFHDGTKCWPRPAQRNGVQQKYQKSQLLRCKPSAAESTPATWSAWALTFIKPIRLILPCGVLLEAVTNGNGSNFSCHRSTFKKRMNSSRSLSLAAPEILLDHPHQTQTASPAKRKNMLTGKEVEYSQAKEALARWVWKNMFEREGTNKATRNLTSMENSWSTIEWDVTASTRGSSSLSWLFIAALLH